jgi:hypothetical protein
VAEALHYEGHKISPSYCNCPRFSMYSTRLRPPGLSSPEGRSENKENMLILCIIQSMHYKVMSTNINCVQCGTITTSFSCIF